MHMGVKLVVQKYFHTISFPSDGGCDLGNIDYSAGSSMADDSSNALHGTQRSRYKQAPPNGAAFSPEMRPPRALLVHVLHEVVPDYPPPTGWKPSEVGFV
ncbi:hypothetical protein Bbelb_411610 [Branchiostoma belcheri]|nr:hypothetical protein Bbelb_411610 [Branchiostoma belcheri]